MGKGEVREFVANTDPIPNNKTGSLFTAGIHIFCAIVGAGVLALPRSVAWLGWVAGPLLITMFFFISLLASRLLAEVYCVNGVEHARYHHAVRHIMGKGGAIGVSIFQLTNIFLICVAYTVTGATALKEVASVACDEQGIASDSCWNETWKLTLLFGATEVVLSMVPNLESAWWVSFIGVATSFAYSTIALVLSLIKSGNHGGTVGGIQASDVNKTFGILNSLGAIAFAYSFSLILLEIQDTLRQPPNTIRTMKRAVDLGVGMSFVFYITVAVAGYLAFGNEVPGMILTAFSGPRWLIQLANMCIVIHMITAWQIYAQPLFDTLESWVKAARLKMVGKGARATADVERAGGPEPRKSMAGYTLDVAAVEPLGKLSAMPTPMITAVGPEGGAPAGAIAAAPAGPTVVNTAPHLAPDAHIDTHSASPSPIHVQRVSMRASAGPPLDRASTRSNLSQRLSRLSQQAGMYHVDTGFTNEAVPLNDERYYIPFWQRFIIRTIYTCIITVISVVVPFFTSIAGLVGALTFYPLMIYFPFRMWRKVWGSTHVLLITLLVYKPKGLFNIALWVVDVAMLLVCAAATVAAVRGIINSWSSYKIFGD